MFSCPNCNELGVSAWAKFRASTATPAVCIYCGKPSSMGGNILGAFGGIFHLLFLAFTFTAFYYWSFWPLISYCFLFMSVNMAMVKWTPLKSLTEAQVKKSRRYFYIFVIIFVLLVIAAGIIEM
jgi:hypothetical protein